MKTDWETVLVNFALPLVRDRKELFTNSQPVNFLRINGCPTSPTLGKKTLLSPGSRRLVDSDQGRVLAARPSTLTAVRLFEQLPEHPIVTVALRTSTTRLA